ncbi:MAG: response regulator [Limisphaerales bacterium]
MVPILIVDDAREDLVFAQRVLTANRILNPLHLFSSGKDCLDYFMGKTTVVAPQLPCIVFLDMIMKPVSGLEVLRKARNMPAAKGSLFIMLSGLTDIKKIAEGYRLGASTFLIKPLVSAELSQMLQSVNGLAMHKTSTGLFLSIASSPASSFMPEQHADRFFPPARPD